MIFKVVSIKGPKVTSLSSHLLERWWKLGRKSREGAKIWESFVGESVWGSSGRGHSDEIIWFPHPLNTNYWNPAKFHSRLLTSWPFQFLHWNFHRNVIKLDKASFSSSMGILYSKTAKRVSFGQKFFTDSFLQEPFILALFTFPNKNY